MTIFGGHAEVFYRAEVITALAVIDQLARLARHRALRLDTPRHLYLDEQPVVGWEVSK